jgi:hypothetical protein
MCGRKRSAYYNFINGLMHSVGSVAMMQMSIDKYFRGAVTAVGT